MIDTSVLFAIANSARDCWAPTWLLKASATKLSISPGNTWTCNSGSEELSYIGFVARVSCSCLVLFPELGSGLFLVSYQSRMLVEK